MTIKPWLSQYHSAQKTAHDSIPLESVGSLVEKLAEAHKQGRQIFIFGNGGSAANASHFATDLGKGSSDKIGKPFHVLSLTDNVSWITALGNDYAYDQVFVRQLRNYGKAGDIAIGISVSGSSPNCVKALEWAKENQLFTVALVGGKRGHMADLADMVLAINDTHYGRVEDAQMTICHMLCYAFIEHPEWAG